RLDVERERSRWVWRAAKRPTTREIATVRGALRVRMPRLRLRLPISGRDVASPENKRWNKTIRGNSPEGPCCSGVLRRQREPKNTRFRTPDRRSFLMMWVDHQWVHPSSPATVAAALLDMPPASNVHFRAQMRLSSRDEGRRCSAVPALVHRAPSGALPVLADYG